MERRGEQRAKAASSSGNEGVRGRIEGDAGLGSVIGCSSGIGPWQNDGEQGHDEFCGLLGSFQICKRKQTKLDRENIIAVCRKNEAEEVWRDIAIGWFL